ncbi:hypothetical protein G9G63_10375 [Paenibacillus sp. EKM202P]|uniref:LPD38 domain-containing protein n=1 Tax=unclassified Paenibacillus TaxID=185978 RepID=UPI0013EE348A|nr:MULTISPECIES: LPD38 domain-containing protein [unclassified Paenibacillus]KAF6564537.1 hypothetical protein G9G63_10375 [Paenibacillus sp. EKM202P]KAF6571648.1 hypothetical protein G9G64_06400 [Paenibacillus sp. EKM207P]
MASEFDAVRNRRKQGADAKARVLARASNPNVGGVNAESEFAAVRNRTADISPPTLLDNVKSTLTSPGVKDFVNKGLNYAGQEMQRQAANREKNRLKLPPSLIIKPGFIENSTFGQATQGNRDAIGIYKAATGKTIKPLTEYEQRMEEIQRTAQEHPYLKPIQPIAEWATGLMSNTDTGNFVNRAVGTGGSMIVGEQPYYNTTTGNATADKVADITGMVGGIAGMAFNPAAPGVKGQNLLTGPLAAAEAGLATRTGNALTNTISRQAARIPGVSAGTADRLTRGALSGAAAGAIGNTAIGINQDQTTGQEMLHNAALGAAFGAGGDLLIRGVGAGARAVTGRGNNATQVADTLALPLGRGDQRMAQAGQRSNLVRGDDAIVNPTDWTPEPLGLPAGRNSTFIGESPLPAQRVGARPGASREPVQRVSESSINRQRSFNINDPAVPEFMRVRQARIEAANARKIPTETQRVAPEVEVDEIVRNIQQPRIRDRVYNYLDEAEKAARERIQKRKNNLNSNPLPEWRDWSIVGAAKMGKGTIKFADWAEEMVKEVGEDFRPHAEKVYRASKEELRKQERLATKEGDDAVRFNSQDIGDVDTFSAKISKDVNKRRTSFSQKIERIRTQFEDDVISLAGLEKRVTGRVASAENSLYKKARLYKGAPEKAHQIVKQRLAPVITAAEKAGYTADDIGKYALAVHAKDVNAAGYKSGFTDKEIAAVIQKYGSEEMEAARKELVQVGKDMMKELVDSGVISKELANVLDNRWKNYIPLFRAFEDTPEAFAGGLSKSLANVASPIKALKGSEKKVVDPLENMVRNIFQTVNASERNKVATELAKLAKKDVDENFIRRLGPDEQVGRKNVINVKENGESVKYEVEPEVYRALMNLDKESSSMIISIFSKPASLLRSGATLTPEFSLRNPMRDVLQAYVTSESGFNPITDFTVGLIQSISKGKLYQKWIDELGAYGNVISMDRNVHRRALESVLKEKPSKKFINIINGKGMLNLLRAVSDTTESATKVGEFRAALRSGATPQEAAYRSRDLMDFARSGSSIRQINRVVAFLNANIQGKSKLVRAIKANPWRTTTRMITAITLPTVGVFVWNQKFANETQRQTIDEAPDWMRDTFWLIAVPNSETVARIPKPFDMAPLFANLPERAMRFIFNNDKEAFDGFAKRVIGDSAIPTQITGMLPFVEGMVNYSFFRQGPIIPQREQGLEYKDQYDPVRTTETARFLAGLASKVTNDEGGLKNFSSPRIMDSTIQGLTAGLGNYATTATDAILKGTGLVDRPNPPEKRFEQLPLVKAFTVDPLQSTKSIEKLYDTKEKLSKEKASAKLNEGDFSRKRDLKTLEKAAKSLSELNASIREIEADKTMSSAEKRRQIEPLLSERNRIAKTTMQGFPK